MTNTNKTSKTYSEIHTLLTQEKPRSAWTRGVNNIALNIVDEILQEYNGDEEAHFNCVDDFARHFYNASLREAVDGGCFLIYDYDIARNFCTPTELNRVKNGERNPNSCETWLDVMYRGAYQAIRHIITLQRGTDMSRYQVRTKEFEKRNWKIIESFGTMREAERFAIRAERKCRKDFDKMFDKWDVKDTVTKDRIIIA